MMFAMTMLMLTIDVSNLGFFSSNVCARGSALTVSSGEWPIVGFPLKIKLLDNGGILAMFFSGISNMLRPLQHFLISEVSDFAFPSPSLLSCFFPPFNSVGFAYVFPRSVFLVVVREF